ncbi:glycosyltransferase family 4 protein [Deinococcus arenicola]|uniref:Glycosyltransferase family 4 protein n=1 Tax=Deinococcus arenicola TaxID=2994950 RepID=A0ABU4DTB8_9DEIO|nr:glycosyltransferase family 4 protein [Deinococcus sp. ZS9-10]MDV6375677.1 glycosyltransferase family 4 protein [Deinococcus sp. ZS9-10]
MKVLVVHNFYQQAGGEDSVFRAEVALLEGYGHDVRTFTVSNDMIAQTPRLQAAAQTLHNRQMAREITRQVRGHGSQIVHFHNTFPILSPAVYAGARAGGAAVVQTLHNYRLMCANGLFFRDGHVCEDCLGQLPLPAVRHRCYRDSAAASAVVAAMQVTHRAAGTYRNGVDAYIALTEFARDKFIAGGLPAGRIAVKPNFLAGGPGPGTGEGGYALYVGRLSPEKGVDTLLRAWAHLGDTLPLKIVGDGPLAPQVTQAAATLPGVTWLGQQDRAGVLELMQNAAFLVLPSEWYEGFPMTLIEAWGVGLPVLGSHLGALGALIEPGQTGMLFRAGNADDLAAQVRWLRGHPEERKQMGTGAFQLSQTLYSPERNHEQLMEIYAAALKRFGAARGSPAPV